MSSFVYSVHNDLFEFHVNQKKAEIDEKIRLYEGGGGMASSVNHPEFVFVCVS